MARPVDLHSKTGSLTELPPIAAHKTEAAQVTLIIGDGEDPVSRADRSQKPLELPPLSAEQLDPAGGQILQGQGRMVRLMTQKGIVDLRGQDSGEVSVSFVPTGGSGLLVVGPSSPDSLRPVDSDLARLLIRVVDHSLWGPSMSGGRTRATIAMGKQLGAIIAQGEPAFGELQQQLKAGAVAIDSKNYSEAEQTLKPLTSASNRSNRSRAYQMLGLMQHRLGDYEQAKDSLHDALFASPRKEPQLELAIRTDLTKVYRSMRKFDVALRSATQAVGLAERIAANGGTANLKGAYFDLAIIQKNLSRLDDAVASLQKAHEHGGQGFMTGIALAGYLALAGRADEGKKLFDSFEAPADPLGKFDFAMNATWYAAATGDRAEVLAAAAKAVAASVPVGMEAVLTEYFNSEADLDAFRNDPAFVAVLASGS